MIPKRRKQPRMAHKDATVIRCAAHLQFVRGHECSLAGVLHDLNACIHGGGIEAAHVRTHGDGGTGMKPGDDKAIPLCSRHHREQHQIGERAFEGRYGIKMAEIAAELWAKSPHGIKYRTLHQDE